ncbi:MAG: FolD bifunctional protein nonfunctional [Candidatus Saccharibacteria bacterium]|nr:FolD bifunctional protein nonfunctional [Candidatus Saccharibacteria bacterium]
MKILNGSELAGYIKERHSKSVRSLKQSQNVLPRLAIIRTNEDPVVDTYMRLKTAYGEDIGVAVDVHTIDQSEAMDRISKLNEDQSVHGIIVQLPLPDSSQTDEVLNHVNPAKDVDGLGAATQFDAPTPTAITWLLSGYGIDLPGRQIVIVGQGRLVGAPLAKMWQNSGLKIDKVDKNTSDLENKVGEADIVISAAGQPGLITNDMVKAGAVVIDAGVSTDSNGLIGDVAPEVRQREDVTITPENGGVGPLTVAALFENVIRAASHG